MATLSITKYSNKVWKFIASDVPADFSFSKLQVDTDGNSFVIVSQGGATTNSYQLADITVYASEGGTPETGWLSMEALLLRLEELNFPAWNESGAVLDFNLRVQQDGETVISNVNKLIFDGATVVNNGDDSVTITITGGGGGVTEFTELTDVPASYTGQGSKVVAVKSDETGLEFVAGGGSQDLQSVLDNGDTAVDIDGFQIQITPTNVNLSNLDGNFLSFDAVNGISLVTPSIGEILISLDGFEVTSGVEGGSLKYDRINFRDDTSNQYEILKPDIIDSGVATIKFPEINALDTEIIATREWVIANVSGGAVDSVNGQTGVVVLDSDDISEGATNLYFTDARALGAIPDATPTVKGIAKLYTSLGSNTDGAVDQNTINTALALKANAPLIDTVSSSPITGVTTEGILKSYLIPANTLTASEILNFANDLYKTGTAGTVTSRLYTNTTASLSGASLLATNISTAGNRKVPLRRQLVLKGGNIEVLVATQSLPDDNLNSSGVATIVTFNPAVDNYFITTAQNASAGDSTIQNNLKLHY